jgi:hypothetical protein
MTPSRFYQCLCCLALLHAWPAYGQGLSFAQPELEVHSVTLVEWATDKGGNGHFYEAVAAPPGINWADAQSYAEAHHGYLATIATEQENNFVFKLIDAAAFWVKSPSGDSWGPWLGGSDTATISTVGSSWQWLHGEGFFSYRNWASQNNPNDHGPNNRLIFFGPGANNRQSTWNHVTADQRLEGFVVEYDQNPLPATLQYVALFAVSIVGLIALGSVTYFIVVWQRGRTRTAETLDR